MLVSEVRGWGGVERSLCYFSFHSGCVLFLGEWVMEISSLLKFPSMEQVELTFSNMVEYLNPNITF